MRRHPRGFALIITLSLMILLTVIAVGLLVLSSISIRSVSRESAVQAAQANARLGLMIALGELQKSAGPDTRITARAETLAKDTRVGVPVAANTPRAWWVGVSDSNPANILGNAGSPAVMWLLSGLSGTSPGGQISASPAYPVKMIGNGSLDLATATGGSPVEAGRVKIIGGGKATGAYAWFVDDNGMKAQLAATRPAVRNDSMAGPLGGPFGGGVIPGTYNLSVLDQMGSLSGLKSDNLEKLVSTHNLPLLGLPASVTKSKYFSYTTSSQGVLSDVKNGGLKKDLTIAFERPAVFNFAFPSSQPDKYIAVDRTKRQQAGLDLNNYIHWGIFRDYYNLKNSLFNSGGIPSLAPTLFHKGGLSTPLSTDPFRAGSLGPHAMATSASSTPQAGLPYGNTFTVSPTNVGNPSAYLFNPIFPVLGSLQSSAWVSRTPTGLRSNVQLFTTDYNPYNVGIMINGKSGSGSGPRIHNYPQVLFTAAGTTMNRSPGLHEKLQTHARPAMQLEPGRSHVMGFGSDVVSGQEIDGSQYSENISKIVAQSVFKEFPGATVPATGNVSLTYEFALTTPALLHGADEDPGDNEVAQVFFSPFAWDSIAAFPGVSTCPGKKITRSVPASSLTQNNQVTMGFNLRTTKEPSQNAIRPLVDANIRAVWNNPRWDSPLGLPLLAAYSAEGNGELPAAIPQMEFGTTGGKGYAYWGNSRSASGGNDRVILFDVPRRDLVSIGQLQHANAGRFSYEPSYIVGNSYANPRIPLTAWRASVTDSFSASRKLPWSIGGNFNLYDASYLVNDVAFDSYTFTTIPQVSNNYGGSDGLPVNAATYSGLMAGTKQLPNPRYLPYKPPGSDFTMPNLTSNGSAAAGSYFHNAGHLVVDGAFNVNSTSVDAWEAFLSGTHKLPVQKIDANGNISGFRPVEHVRFPRAASHLQDGMTKSSIDDSYWTGFRQLETKEVRQLAEEIVLQVRQRGPFLTLGQFINRKLESTDLGKSGTLQAALDLTANKDLDKSFESPAAITVFKTIPATSTQGAGFPGQLLQGDILQSLAPVMTVRSDTFTIRGYGEALDTGGNVTARAWCEAVVQRIPDPMPTISGTSNAMAELIKPSSPFGRKFNILTFRWLHPEEV